MIHGSVLRIWFVLVLVILAGCVAPIADSGSTQHSASTETPQSADRSGTGIGDVAGGILDFATDRPSDRRDVIGWENGYWHNDSIAVNLSDGLSDDERKAYLARAMARVEYIRGHEFTRPVTFEVVTREDLQARVEQTGSFASEDELSQERIQIINQFWEALFFVGEDQDVIQVRAREQSNFLGAYYLFGTDTIRVVTQSSADWVISERLLIHELVHALQDEYADTPLETTSDDDNYATSALIEGDATFVERRYLERCETGEWECVTPPDQSNTAPTSSGEIHRGFRALRSFAYSDGPAFVHHLYEEGRDNTSGWAAVDRAYTVRPRTTKEIIHPTEYPLTSPESPAPEITPQAGWQHLGGLYIIGEVEIFMVFWYQSVRSMTPLLDTDAFYEPEGGPYDRYNYSSTPSVGWNGDGLEMFVNDRETGYVWTTDWESETEAQEFRNAYIHLLNEHAAQRVGDSTWVIRAGGFADAFYVERAGTTVRIVNGPSIRDLSNIYPAIDE